MTLAFIGIGNVGFAIANTLQKKGHDILIAHDNSASESVQNALVQNPNFKVQPIQEAVNAADVVVCSIPFKANEMTLKDLEFQGKTLIDCTNPVGAGISHGLKSEISGSEKVQEWAASAKVVKAFSIYGFENLIDSAFPNFNVKPVMMIAGNDADAKTQVAQICTDMGFETLDTGKLDQALHLEHMTLLWVKMARRDKHHPNFAWAYLEK
jgi:8-hydroxy-5-deazaflavin:NADPH oxidoreductase